MGSDQGEWNELRAAATALGCNVDEVAESCDRLKTQLDEALARTDKLQAQYDLARQIIECGRDERDALRAELNALASAHQDAMAALRAELARKTEALERKDAVFRRILTLEDLPGQTGANGNLLDEEDAMDAMVAAALDGLRAALAEPQAGGEPQTSK